MRISIILFNILAFIIILIICLVACEDKPSVEDDNTQTSIDENENQTNEEIDESKTFDKGLSNITVGQLVEDAETYDVTMKDETKSGQHKKEESNNMEVE